MNILIKQSRWTFLGAKYIVSVAGVKRIIIEREPFIIPYHFKILDYETSETVGSVTNKFKLKGDASISIRNERFQFVQSGIGEMTYHCVNHDLSIEYEIQGNHGNSVSVFKNKEQIAYWRKKSFVVLNRNQFDVVINKDEDVILLSTLVVLVDIFRNSIVVGGDIGWDIGNLSKKLADFDEKWLPKDEL